MEERAAIRLKWALAAAAAVLIVEGAVAAALVLGAFDSSALRGYSQPTSWLIHRTMIDSVRERARDIAPPPGFTRAEVLAGLRTYERRCVMCHGGPGVGRETWVSGMHPTPPYLLDSARHWRSRELYLVISDGVKMTGMPAWSLTLSRGEIWNLVGFLEALPNMTAADYARLRGAEAPKQGQAASSTPGGARS
jgi:mono/diheme cytochrome c family protein